MVSEILLVNGGSTVENNKLCPSNPCLVTRCHPRFDIAGADN